ncbi:MAG: DNA translocase FtsK [Tepidisphaeraceae bacterium]|jgi:S-DNA-T family DNA segregation ATPase FtsK/SpoIIIE
MDRENLKHRVGLFIAIFAWVFFFLAFASFNPEDWPSHEVFPHPPTHNLCGKVGALVAYYLFYAIGQGVFPIIFFTGICLLLVAFRNRISDLWLRTIGLVLLSVAFAGGVHLIHPGSRASLPEGYGGILGIGTVAFLKSHFSTVGSALFLLAGITVGLLLAADDLVMRAPAVIVNALVSVRSRTRWLPDASGLVSKLSGAKDLLSRMKPTGKAGQTTTPGSGRNRDEIELPPKDQPTVLRANRLNSGEKMASDLTVNGQTIEFTYEHDQLATPAIETTYTGEADAPPSESAVIPPPERQAVVPPPPLMNNSGAALAALPPTGFATPAAPGNQPVALPPPPAVAVPVAAAPAAPLADTTHDNEPDAPGVILRSALSVKPRTLEQPPPPKELGDYKLPPWTLLFDAEHGFADEAQKFALLKAEELKKALKEFNLDAQLVAIDTGPVITMYEIRPAPGLKVAAFTQLSNDIARALSATSVRIVAPVPGKDTVGIEVPNAKKELVRIKELMQLAPEAQQKMQIPLYLGKDASGVPLVADLAVMPHALIAGTTGSGKSFCINTIIMSILYTQRPDMVKLILFDPKVVELAAFKDIPHLMCPVINDAARATSVLEWACTKMDERYEILAEAGVRNVAGYNKLTKEQLCERFQPGSPEEEAKIPKFLPYVVIVIDELADLMMTSGKEVEQFIVRIAQKARAVGIHLVLATQRPQANVVTGLIKANMPAKIAYRVNSRMDSRIVLDQNGADLLLGKGDMLFLPPGQGKPIRAQGTYSDDIEMRETVKYVREQAEAQYEGELVQIRPSFNASEIAQDELFDDAVRIVIETKRGSVSLLQRRMGIGYGRASRLIDMMAASGILGDYKGTQAREVVMTIEEWESARAQMNKDHEDGMTV